MSWWKLSRLRLSKRTTMRLATWAKGQDSPSSTLKTSRTMPCASKSNFYLTKWTKHSKSWSRKRISWIRLNWRKERRIGSMRRWSCRISSCKRSSHRHRLKQILPRKKLKSIFKLRWTSQCDKVNKTRASYFSKPKMALNCWIMKKWMSLEMVISDSRLALVAESRYLRIKYIWTHSWH